MSTGKHLTRRFRTWWLAVLLAGLGIAALYLLRKFGKSSKQVKREPERVFDDQGKSIRLVGLTADEAAARQGDFDLDSEIRKEDRIFLRAAIRQSLFSIYNVDLDRAFGIRR